MNLKALPFLAVTCLLAACGRTPATVTPPVATTPSALYELNFQNVGSSQATASAQRLGAGLAVQSLENAPEPLGLGNVPLSTLEFVTTENGRSVRHAQATFKLTNTSGRALKNLVFLPVALNDTDGDPSNNAQAPTAGGTPFRTVRYFDGSDASALAGTLTPVQGQRLNADKTAAQPDPDADAYFRGLSTAGLDVAAPAGLSVKVTDGGWLAATSLAAGASTNVTFAVDIGGVDPANLKATPYSFSLLVTGGEDATATDLSSSVDPASIQGVIPDWTYGEGQVVDQYSNTLYATVGTAGVVGGTLPTPTTTFSAFQGCTFKGTQTADDVRGSAISTPLRVLTAQGDLIATLSETTAEGDEVTRLYAASDAMFRGVQTCVPYGDTVLDLDLKRGWNVLARDRSGAVRSLPAGTRTVLTVMPAPEAVTVNFPDQSELSLRAGQTATRSVRLNQSGAISGDVTLETDVPGVTVTPSTLRLPNLKGASVNGGGLGALGLGAQVLNSTLTFTADAEAKAYTGPLSLIVKKGGAEVGRGTLYSARVVVPAVSAYFTNSLSGQTGSLAQGETRDFPVALSSVEGYAGTTTVTLAGLPAGVSATTETVTLTANGQANATIKLTVGPDVAVGTLFDIQAVGPKITTPYNPPQRYQIVPLRTPLKLSGISRAVAAGDGVWVFDAQGKTLVRISGTQEVQRETVELAPSSSYGMFPMPDGSVFIASSSYDGAASGYTQTFVRLTQNGEKSVVRFAAGELKESGSLNGRPDAQGNFWFVGYGDSGYALKKLDLATRVVTTVSVLSGYPSSHLGSPDGRTLVFFGSSTTYRVNTADASVSSMTADTSGRSPLFLDNAGNTYGMNYQGVVRTSPQGETRTYNAVSYGTLLGVDRADANILWVADGSQMRKLNLFSGEVKNISLYSSGSFGPYISSVDASLNGGGGAWLLGSSNAYNGTPPTYFASLVK